MIVLAYRMNVIFAVKNVTSASGVVIPVLYAMNVGRSIVGVVENVGAVEIASAFA